MKLYMGVTPDKYELPLFVADSLRELSKMSGVDYDSVRHLISKIVVAETGELNL